LNVAWNLNIGKQDDTNRSLRFATIHRALHHYFFSDRLGLKKPYDPSWYQWKLKVGYTHRDGTSNALPFLSIVGRPHAEVYGRNEGSNTWTSTNNIFATTIHELAHVSHWELVSQPVFSNVWWNTSTRILCESWAVAVEWGLTNSMYNWLGQTYGNSDALQYNHGQFDDLGAGKQKLTINISKYYTPLYIDMVDNINQRQIHGGGWNAIYPQDNVTGYTLSQIENQVLPFAVQLDVVKWRLKQIKPQGVTDAQVDALMDSYLNL
jgi:hypothetical protein